MGTIVIDFDSDEIRCPYLSTNLMNGIIYIREEREGYLIFLSEDIYLHGGCSCADPDYLNLPFEIRIILYGIIEFIYRRRFFLAIRAIHAEDFDNHHSRLNLGNGKRTFSCESQVIFLFWALGNRKFYDRQWPPLRWRFTGSKDGKSEHEDKSNDNRNHGYFSHRTYSSFLGFSSINVPQNNNKRYQQKSYFVVGFHLASHRWP